MADYLFPFTKLSPPQLGSSFVKRARLQSALFAAVPRHKLTLIAAPAGSGKTVLASTLIGGDWPVVWLTLDATDDDLPVFLSLLAGALGDQLQNEGQAIMNFLQSVPNAYEKAAQIATILINQLRPAGDLPTVLILDDYHALKNETVHEFISYLLDYLPPQLRIVITARHDPPLPLARLRARDELAEIRLSLLRFNHHETAEFFNQRHLLDLTAEEVALLQRHTEGWVAGLQLLGTVLAAFKEQADRSSYISHLGPTNLSIFDLLAEEVLALQPADIQDFLLQTSVLLELTPQNCQAVMQNPAAGRLLADAYRRNLFLRTVAGDAHSGPFRYHDLFRDFLQLRLQEQDPQLWRELHGRAAGATTNPEQKLLHLRAAERWADAADLLEEMGQGDSISRIYRHIVVESIEALPAEVVERRPWLQLYVAQYYSFLGQIETAAPWLARADAGFLEQGDVVGQLEILTARAMTDALDTDEIVSEFRRMIETSSHLFRPDHWMVYHGAEMWHGVAIHDWATLTEHLQTQIGLALESDDPGALTWAAMTIGPEMLFNDAGMESQEQITLRSLELAGKDEWLLRINALDTLAFIRFFQGQIDEAEELIYEARLLLDEIGGQLAWVDDHIYWLVLALALARRSYRAFDEFYAAQVDRWQAQDTSLSYRLGFNYLRGRSLWLRGRLDEAEEVLAQMKNTQGPTPYATDDEERRLLLAGLIGMSRENDQEAEEYLRQALKHHQRVRHTLLLSHPGLALATFYGRNKQWREAMKELKLVINELSMRGAPGVILQEGESIVPVLQYALDQGIEEDMLRPLLNILQPDETPQPIPLPNSDQYLTARESEVLQLLATGATNKEIASDLFITERTVKSHVTRILAKLDSSTRTEAVTRAGRLGLI